MQEKIANITKEISSNEPLTAEAFAKYYGEMMCTFADDYLDYMRVKNGGEGFLENDFYIQLWKFEDLLRYNKGYKVDEFADDLFFIGLDGGGTAYGIRKSTSVFVDVPFIGMSNEDAVERGYTFEDFLTSIISE